jgi:poly(hydroxyalkanoate) granule-associated protein
LTALPHRGILLLSHRGVVGRNPKRTLSGSAGRNSKEHTMATTLDLQKIQQDVTESARKVWLAGLGTVAIAEERGSSLLQEGGKMFNQLVDRGRGFEVRAEKGLDKEVKKVATEVETRVGKVTKKVGKVVDEQLGNVMNRLGVPTQSEIENLTRRVAQLTEQVDRLVPMLAEKAEKAAPKAAAKA